MFVSVGLWRNSFNFICYLFLLCLTAGAPPSWILTNAYITMNNKKKHMCSISRGKKFLNISFIFPSKYNKRKILIRVKIMKKLSGLQSAAGFLSACFNAHFVVLHQKSCDEANVEVTFLPHNALQHGW